MLCEAELPESVREFENSQDARFRIFVDLGNSGGSASIVPGWESESMFAGERLEGVRFTADCQCEERKALDFAPPAQNEVRLGQVFRYTFENLGDAREYGILNFTENGHCAVAADDKRAIECVFRDFPGFGAHPVGFSVCLADAYENVRVDLNLTLVVPEPVLRSFSLEIDDSFRLLLPTTVVPMLLHGVRVLNSSNERVCAIGFDRRFVNCSTPGKATIDVEYQAYGQQITQNFTVELRAAEECAPPGCNGALTPAALAALDEELFGTDGAQ